MKKNLVIFQNYLKNGSIQSKESFMKRNKLKFQAIVLIVASSVLSGCSSEGSTTSANSDSQIVNPTGKYIINPQFEDSSNFSEGLAAVKSGGKWGYIDKTGAIVVNPQFDSAYSFVKPGQVPISFFMSAPVPSFR